MAVVLSPVVAMLASLVGDQTPAAAAPPDRSLSCDVVRPRDPVCDYTREQTLAGRPFELPVLIRRVAPKRPTHLRGRDGVVVLEIVVSAAGRVESPCVVLSLNPSLDLEAVKAVKRWRFIPAKVDGHPVKAVTAVTVAFRKSRG
jgi:TonB family protein